MLNISNWVHSLPGAIHLVCAVVAMLSGIFVLLNTKGTAFHRKCGYVFVITLIGVNVTALFIYDFNNGSVSVFHFLIPVSVFFLGFGFLPMLGRRKPNAVNRHIIGMNGAVYGLWAAGATELFVREFAFYLDPSKNELMLYSFLISAPFAIAITVSIVYHQRKYLQKAG